MELEVIQNVEYVRGKTVITFESGWRVWLNKEPVPEFPLEKNVQIEHEQFEKFVVVNQYPAALEKAVTMLAMRDRSIKEIYEILQKFHFEPGVIKLAVFKLEKEGLLDDQKFSIQWVQNRIQKYGPSRIARELHIKGIDNETSAKAFESCNEEEQLQAAVSTALKKIKQTLGKEDRITMYRKITAMLVRRGYSWETAKKAFNTAYAEIDKI